MTTMSYRHRVQSFCRWRTLAPLLALLFLCQACSSPATTQQAAAKAALAGQQLCDAALTTYKDLASFQQIDQDQQDQLNALSGSSHVAKTTSFAAELLPRIAAYQSLKETYATFGNLASTDFSGQSQKAASGLLDSVNALKAIPKLPDTVTKLIPDLTAQVVGQIQAGDVRKHSQVLAQLEKAYQAAWEADRVLWMQYVNKVYSSYADALPNVPDDAFDAKAVADQLKTPFAQKAQIPLFKQKLALDARQPVDHVEQDFDAVSKAFDLLQIAHAELQKKAPAPDVIGYTLDTALAIAKDVQPIKKQNDKKGA
jgi:hypothetical protein